VTSTRLPVVREYIDTVAKTTFDRTRESPFSYTCGQCGKCCEHKVIRVGPYELLRLARNRGLSTTDFLREHTEAGGTVLRVREDFTCTFLTDKGCSVHADRPVVCRIYPLGWFRDAAGNETFGQVEGHPESKGVFGTDGTVAEYCASQGLEEYLQRAREYIALHDRLLAVLQQGSTEDPAVDLAKPRTEIDHLSPGELASRWLDVDAVVAEYCRSHGRAVPTAIDETIDLHQRALLEWANGLV
jgi:Fe-S-cluster containining protein